MYYKSELTAMSSNNPITKEITKKIMIGMLTLAFQKKRTQNLRNFLEIIE